MPISFSNVWNTWLYNAEEDPIEAYVVVPQEAPESEQPVDNLNASNSPDAEASNTETSTTEKGNIDNLASSAETVVSNLPDVSQIEAENEQSELVVAASDASIFLTGHTNVEFSDSNCKIRRRFPLTSDEDHQRSPACSPENTLNEKLFSNSPALDTESSNTEEGKMGNLDSTEETAASNLPGDSQNEAENEQFKLVFLPTDATTGHSTEESPDSDSDSKTIVNEDDQSSSPSPSSPAEDKLRKKLFLFDTAASIIGLAVPVLAIAFGLGNIGNCPANFSTPYFVLIMGILSLFMVSYALFKSNRKNFEHWTKFDEDVMFMTTYILFYVRVFKNWNFMDASFDSSAINYCNHAFYIFNVFLDIFLAVGFIMGCCLFDLHNARPSPPTPDDHWKTIN